MARFRKQFQEKVVPELMSKFSYKSPMQVPRFEKITLNMGLGEGVTDKKLVESAVNDLANIAGQRPIVTKARKAIAGFKLREGMPIGAKVTLRGVRMYEFLDRLITVALPRVRDFRGILESLLMGGEILVLGLKSKSFFLRLSMTKLTR